MNKTCARVVQHRMALSFPVMHVAVGAIDANRANRTLLLLHYVKYAVYFTPNVFLCVCARLIEDN